MTSLAKATGLLTNTKSLSTNFGSNPIAQEAALVLFSVASQHGNAMQDSWKHIMTCIKNLFKFRLIPEQMLYAEDFLCGKVMLYSEKDSKRNQPKGASIFSTFSSFLYAPEPEPELETEEQKLSQRRALECIMKCKIADLFDDSRFLHEDAISHLLRAMILASYVLSDKKQLRFLASDSQSTESDLMADQAKRDATVSGFLCLCLWSFCLEWLIAFLPSHSHLTQRWPRSS